MGGVPIPKWGELKIVESTQRRVLARNTMYICKHLIKIMYMFHVRYRAFVIHI